MPFHCANLYCLLLCLCASSIFLLSFILHIILVWFTQFIHLVFLSSVQCAYSFTLHRTHTQTHGITTTTTTYSRMCTWIAVLYTYHRQVQWFLAVVFLYSIFLFLISDHTWVFCTRSPYNWHNQIWNDRARAYINQFKREGRQKRNNNAATITLTIKIATTM